ncbi:hypothetical protein BC6307_14995 [Sutcliffiella cohnii]|uniref:Cxxc_20_cxxc protein n=1 Tax=Sutcliffiella cohnii TaxID=33932 RepID=A0A223KSN6_9BACI|nr:TIGR04104 family putative zinc finger protein [Sutcliffiella cohnii]AST92505.1 hypothetical protein BC6307_14995 [Sutcliffiella cohnii]
MPTCQSCGTKWGWKQTIKKSFTFHSALECPYCGKKQYWTTKSRRKVSFSTMIIPFFIIVPSLFTISRLLILSMLISLCLLVLSIIPFIMELSDEEEPLW